MSDHFPLHSERVSALMDGELRGAEFAQAALAAGESPDARSDWDTYHLIGVALRSRTADLRLHDPDFVARLRDRLAREPMRAAPRSTPVVQPQNPPATAVPAANDARWLRVVGLASVVALAFGLWQGWQSLGGGAQGGGPALAQLTAPDLADSSAGASVSSKGATVMLRDPRLDALLAAHRQRGSVSALQMPAGFLRNATFDEAGR